MDGYWYNLVMLFGIYTISAIGLNFAVGVGGVTNLGQAAFSAIGAYTFALLRLNMGVPFPAALLAGIALATATGTIIGLASRRLRGDGLAIGTLGFGVFVEQVLRNWDEVTRGPMGITSIPQPNLEIAGLDNRATMLIVVGLGVLCCAMLVEHLGKSPYGRMLAAIREEETLVGCLGVNPTVIKMTAMGVSALCGGLAGALYAAHVGFIDPGTFGLPESMLLVFIVLLGGAGSRWGPFIGAVAMLLLQEPLRYVAMKPEYVGAVRQMIFAAILMTIIRFWPKGLASRTLIHQLEVTDDLTRSENKSAPRFQMIAIQDSNVGEECAVRQSPILQCVGLTKRFGDVMALSNVTFTVSAGQILGVIGPNGAGKTTLLNVLTGLELADEGKVLVDGRNILGMENHDIAQLSVGRTFQQVRLHGEASVYENMCLSMWCSTWTLWRQVSSQVGGSSNTDEWEAIRLILERVGLWRERNVRASGLSFGKRKMLQFAMAMMKKPKVLLLDEPAAGLDALGQRGQSSSRAIVAALIKSLARSGTAVLVIEQDTEFVARVAEGVMVLNQGQQVSFGEESPVVIEAPSVVRQCLAVRNAFMGSAVINATH